MRCRGCVPGVSLMLLAELRRTSVLLCLLLLSVSALAQAEEGGKSDEGSALGHAWKALKLSGQAVVHGSVAVLGGLAASGKATLAVLSLPVGASAEVAKTSGMILEKGADAMHSATDDEGFREPLPVSDLIVTAGPPPDQAMTGASE